MTQELELLTVTLKSMKTIKIPAKTRFKATDIVDKLKHAEVNTTHRKKHFYLPIHNSSLTHGDKTIHFKENEHSYIKLSFYYTTGGHNYFTYKEVQRGYYISATPMEVSEYTEKYLMFSGAKILMKPAERYNKRILEEITLEPHQLFDLVEYVYNEEIIKNLKDA